MDRVKELEQKIGYVFKDKSLIERALMHSSYTNEKHLKKYECNERLEFLGDAVLELVSSAYLFNEFPKVSEGELTKTRASMVCEPSLAMCARDIGLGDYLLLGKGEEATGGRKRDSITSDAMEALIGAIYLDGGFTNAKEFIHRFILTDLEDKKLFYDSKTILQEIVQANKAGEEGGVTFAYLSPKLDIDFMYNLNNHYNRQGYKLITRHTLNDEIHNISQSTNGENRQLVHTFRLGGNYKFNEQSQLGLSYTSSLNPDKQQSVTSSDNHSTTFNHAPAEEQMHNVALNYTSGFGLTGGIDYTYFRNKEEQSFRSIENNGQETTFLSNTAQYINRWKVYVDQNHTLSNAWVLNYGTSFTYVNNHNSQRYNLAAMSGMNKESRVDEYTYNLYTGFEKNFGSQWSLNASASIEYYQMISYKKWAIYPTLNLSYVLSPSHILQFELSSNKTYPDYWTLSGSTSYLNNYQESAGNSSLKPYTDYSAALTYILKSKYIFQFSYDYIKDYFMQMIYLDSSRLKAVYNYQNWDYSKEFAFTSVIPFKTGEWWDSQLMICLSSLHQQASNYYDAPFDRRIWNIAGNWTNTFTLSKRPNIKIEISATGTSKSIQGSYTIAPAAFIHTAIRYTFAGDKAMIQIKGNDLFNGSNHLTTKVRNGNQYLDMYLNNYMRNVTVSFSYKFGGFKKKEVKDVDLSRFKH